MWYFLVFLVLIWENIIIIVVLAYNRAALIGIVIPYLAPNIADACDIRIAYLRIINVVIAKSIILEWFLEHFIAYIIIRGVLFILRSLTLIIIIILTVFILISFILLIKEGKIVWVFLFVIWVTFINVQIIILIIIFICSQS